MVTSTSEEPLPKIPTSIRAISPPPPPLPSPVAAKKKSPQVEVGVDAPGVTSPGCGSWTTRMQAAGSVSWVAAAAQASVLGRCGGGGGVVARPGLSADAAATAANGRMLLQGFGVVRCCAQERKPRVRKTKEERRELVESFINTYRITNDGKFPSVNLTHKEVGGSYYIVREIVRDIIQENRVLGPGGLNANVLSFDDCPDPSEVPIRDELDQDSVEVLDMSDRNQVGKDTVMDTEEVLSVEHNAISTQQLLGSSDILDAAILNGVVQNGNVADTSRVETNLEKQDEVLCEKSTGMDLESSEKQAPSSTHVSDLENELELDGLVDDQEATSGITNGVIPSSEPSAVYQTNGALLQEHGTLLNDHHDDTTKSDVDETDLGLHTNGVLQTTQTHLQEQEGSAESSVSNDVLIKDGQLSSTMDGVKLNTSHPETEDTVESIEVSEVQRVQDVFEQSLIDASPDEKQKSEGFVSHPESEALLHMKDKHVIVEEDTSEMKKSVSVITKEEQDAKPEHEINTTAAVSRRTGKTQQKKEDNLFWLIIRAFVVAMSKLWAK